MELERMSTEELIELARRLHSVVRDPEAPSVEESRMLEEVVEELERRGYVVREVLVLVPVLEVERAR